MQVKVKKFRDNAKLPMRMTKGANGYDIFLPEAVVIPASVVMKRSEALDELMVNTDIDRDTRRQLGKELLQQVHSTDSVVNVGRVKIPTGIGLELPPNIDCSTRGRSGCAFGKPNSVFTFGGVDMFLGTIDMDYRGEINLLLFNFTPYPIPLQAGERIGQIIFTRIETPELVWTEELSETERGQGGFGHTDLKEGRQ